MARRHVSDRTAAQKDALRFIARSDDLFGTSKLATVSAGQFGSPDSLSATELPEISTLARIVGQAAY